MFTLNTPTFILTLALMASSVFSATHTVLVAENGSKTYSPSEVKAELEDIVQFTFMAGNHTASQSSFANPCTNAGFKSGFIPGNTTSPTSFSILVNETKPIWVYCAQGRHCQDGMVMAINAPAEGNTFSAFKANAVGGRNATAAGNSTSSATSPSSSASSDSSSSGTNSPNAAASSGSANSTASDTANSGSSRNVELVFSTLGLLIPFSMLWSIL